MAQLIRPCLYGAYHHIELLQEPDPRPVQLRLYDVVGPICESGDLSVRAALCPPARGRRPDHLRGGAYGAAMSSRYNLNFLPAEYLISGQTVTASVAPRPTTTSRGPLFASRLKRPAQHETSPQYGGTSIESADRIRRAAQNIAQLLKSGDQLAVVVSAQGNDTNLLLNSVYTATERHADLQSMYRVVALGRAPSF